MDVDGPRSYPHPFGGYTLIAELGRGGMAQVFLASYEPMPGARRFVAVKRVLPALAQDETFVSMFHDEVRVLSGLYHANLDKILDVGEIDGVPYMALEYIPGRDLLQVLQRHEQKATLSLETSIHIVSKISNGLAHAHARTDEDGKNLGIVHRDVSPENIIVTFEGSVKLVDFGIARGEMRAVVTEPGLIKGKPSFMAPEQILGGTVDHRTDLFALGVLLYRITLGRHPFRVAGNDQKTFYRIVHESPQPPHLVRDEFPLPLSELIMKALSKKAEDRHADARALVDELEVVMRVQGWFPSESALRQMMGQLFPVAAEAARRLSTDPDNLDAVREASYFATGPRLGGNAPPDFREEQTPVRVPKKNTPAVDARLAAPVLEPDEDTTDGAATIQTEPTGTPQLSEPTPKRKHDLPPTASNLPLTDPFTKAMRADPDDRRLEYENEDDDDDEDFSAGDELSGSVSDLATRAGHFPPGLDDEEVSTGQSESPPGYDFPPPPDRTATGARPLVNLDEAPPTPAGPVASPRPTGPSVALRSSPRAPSEKRSVLSLIVIFGVVALAISGALFKWFG